MCLNLAAANAKTLQAQSTLSHLPLPMCMERMERMMDFYAQCTLRTAKVQRSLVRRAKRLDTQQNATRQDDIWSIWKL